MDAARKVACRLRLVGAGADHDEACPARASPSSERAPARERQHLSWGCALGGCREAKECGDGSSTAARRWRQGRRVFVGFCGFLLLSSGHDDVDDSTPQ
jgi:hypothetical protein